MKASLLIINPLYHPENSFERGLIIPRLIPLIFHFLAVFQIDSSGSICWVDMQAMLK